MDDALRLGCSAIGFTIYPGSDQVLGMYEEIRDMRHEAARQGDCDGDLVLSAGGSITKDGETAVDVTAYAAHIAALLGAHIIKVKLPTDFWNRPKRRRFMTRRISRWRP